MSNLADRSCVPCKGGMPPLRHARIEEMLGELDGWDSVEDHHLRRKFETRDFAQALDLVNRFGAIAEEEGHHPVMRFSWGWLEVEIWTHKIDGLTESDFFLAAKFDRAAREVPEGRPSTSQA